MEKNIEIATIGGGCFWCVEAVYLQIKGIEKVISGYMGGSIKNPSYREVCSGLTGHAEVCEIHFDTSLLSFEDILEIFWASHDPTTLNRQGNDRGTQYRSVIYYHNEEQKIKAQQSIESVATNIWSDPIVTELSPLEHFYPAEDYHQNYYALNPQNGYCSVVISPKVSKIRAKYRDQLK